MHGVFENLIHLVDEAVGLVVGESQPGQLGDTRHFRAVHTHGQSFSRAA